MPAEVETAAYRFVQEVLTNVLKHAAARGVSPGLSGIRERLSLADLVVELARDEESGAPPAISESIETMSALLQHRLSSAPARPAPAADTLSRPPSPPGPV